jgi:hypothetical protein
MFSTRNWNRYVDVIRRPEWGLHKCRLPGWLERWVLGVTVSTAIRCRTCGQAYEWDDRGWVKRGQLSNRFGRQEGNAAKNVPPAA